MNSEQEHKVVFAPGCFDDFEGTQEELDAFMAEILEMLKSEDIREHASTDGNIIAIPHVYDNEDEDDVAAVEAYTAQLNAARKRMLN